MSLKREQAAFAVFAAFLNDDFADAALDYDEGGNLSAVSCPSCGDWILFDDWYDSPEETKNWTACPICGDSFF